MVYYTNIGQSKKLLELGLNPETADMVYRMEFDPYDNVYVLNEEYPELLKFSGDFLHGDVSCWTLGALLNVLPEIQGSKPVIALDDNYITYPHISDLHSKAGNLVDACVAMIEKLHKHNLL